MLKNEPGAVSRMLLEPCLHPGTPSFFPSILPSLPLFHFEPCNAGHLHHHHQSVNMVLITLPLVLTSMAVGGLLPERQGWLEHPRYHHLLLLRPDPQHHPVAVRVLQLIGG